MSLEHLRETWTQLGARDAFWAVLTGHNGAARQWDVDAFFRSGADEIATLMQQLPADMHHDAALDFGCGAGRLTRALGDHFDRAVGVDIAPTMIKQAWRLNREAKRCEFVLNDRADLSLFGDESFDLVYSNITLQHMPPELSKRYIEEFFRVVRPRGMVVFQVPGEPIARPPKRTATQQPLPVEAFRAELKVSSRGIRCAPVERFPIVLRIRNISDVLWPADGRDDASFSIRVGNHWRTRWRKRMVQFDDARAALPHDLAPGEETEVGMYVTAPAQSGRYILEFDALQEQVAWFAQHGSFVAQIPVHVHPRTTRVTGLPPRMEMHGIPRVEVEALIRASGGEILEVRDDDAPGPDWTSFRYYAIRRSD